MRDTIIAIKGAGEKASAVAHRLYCSGFKKIIMSEIPHPTCERRGVSFSEAIYENIKEVSGVHCELASSSMTKIRDIWDRDRIALVTDEHGRLFDQLKPDVLIDGVMAKKNTGTSIGLAPLVIALGPGFCAGKDAHYVIETNPAGGRLGAVIEKGEPDINTGIPSGVSGLTYERLIISPESGAIQSDKNIGDRVEKGEIIGYINSVPILAPISGHIWGLIRPSTWVKKQQKLGDINPTGDQNQCFRITPQAEAISMGVLNAILSNS